ncbi:response regulator receiver domain protein [Lentilactobacillus kosonis]|uniref:Response regulator receiver domain protein n=2 Tax=Lentilactobacillus kosonis TaxID=2810561 RepID=A0A401FM25_9LACO|nr:response regulator receiver domain protein [Lentilactobacillus kosonis]
MAYLGQIEGLSVLMISLISYITLRGIDANTPGFIAIFLVGYAVFAYLVKLLQLKKITMLTWLIVVNVVVIGYWFWISGGTFTNANMWYQILAFMITSGCLSFELTQIMTDNNEIIMISRQARTDYLTGLKNDGAFTKELSFAIENSDNDDQPLHLMALDIDHFKMINDQHGHLAGNKILSFVGWSFKQIINDMPGVDCYRVGGEEFDIIFRDVHISDVEEIAREINQQIQMAEIEYKGIAIPITISIGIATKHPNDNSDDLYDRADKMLYTSKRNGRNRITSDNN